MLIHPLFSSEQVEARIDEIARQLYRDYADSPFSLVRVDEGARRFVEALVDRLAAMNVSVDVHPVRVRRTSGSSLAPVEVDRFDVGVLDGRDVLVVDDIADEGVTLAALLDLLELAETRSVRTAVLIDKQERRLDALQLGRRDGLRLDYVGFVVARGWVVGYGMDIDGEFRDLDEIGIVTEID